MQSGPNTTGWSRRLVLRLVSFCLVSLLAIGGSLPLVAFYFNQISLVGLVANFLIVPLIGFITVPLGLAGLFISLLSTTLATWFLGAAAVVLAGAFDIVRFFSELPFAAFKTVTPGLLEIVCYYLLGWAVLVCSAPGRMPGMIRRQTAQPCATLAIARQKISFQLGS